MTLWHWTKKKKNRTENTKWPKIIHPKKPALTLQPSECHHQRYSSFTLCITPPTLIKYIFNRRRLYFLKHVAQQAYITFMFPLETLWKCQRQTGKTSVTVLESCCCFTTHKTMSFFASPKSEGQWSKRPVSSGCPVSVCSHHRSVNDAADWHVCWLMWIWWRNFSVNSES